MKSIEKRPFRRSIAVLVASGLGILATGCSANQEDVEASFAVYADDYKNMDYKEKFAAQFLDGREANGNGASIKVGSYCLRNTPYRTEDYGTFDNEVPSSPQYYVSDTGAEMLKIDARAGQDDLLFYIGEHMLVPANKETAQVLVGNICEFGARANDNDNIYNYTDYREYLDLDS